MITKCCVCPVVKRTAAFRVVTCACLWSGEAGTDRQNLASSASIGALVAARQVHAGQGHH